MAGTGVTTKIVGCLEKNDGKQVSIQQLAQNTGLNKSQIINAMWRLVNNGANIEVISHGTLWIYHAEAKKIPLPAVTEVPSTGQLKIGMVFELIGRSPSGHLIIKSEDGIVYRVRTDDDF